MPDYIYLLESRLSAEQRQLLTLLQSLAQAQEANIYLTGGAVRDLITGMPIRDLDLVIQGNPSRLAHELERHGAKTLDENERLRHIEMLGPGEVDLSLAAARDETFDRPGARPEVRWATIIEDLRRRDFSINAIAVSLNPASRGLLLDPTNGLADVEKREVRVLSMHSFTNQPIRLLRILRFCVRLEFKMEPRTAEWFALAMERGLHELVEGEPLGNEVRQLGREEKCVQILKAWETRGLIGVIHPRLAKRHPDYEGLTKLMRARELFASARIPVRLFVPVTHYLLGRLSPRERTSAMSRMDFRAAEVQAVQRLETDAEKVVKLLRGRKTDRPRDAYEFIRQTPPTLLAFIMAEYPVPRALNKIRNYITRWLPLRNAPPVADLEALGVPPGPKFDKVVEEFFYLQLAGKGRNPHDRLRLLRKLAGIKAEKKIKEKEKEKEPKKKGKGAIEEKQEAAKGKGAKAEPGAEAAIAAPAKAPVPSAPAAAPPAKAGKKITSRPSRTAGKKKPAKAAKKKAKPAARGKMGKRKKR
jgi:tRNA nucleotidyltransferase (CCA-adding enzyme)